MRKLSIVLFTILLSSLSYVKAQYTTTIPLNENVKYGKLSNGMTYYVLHNEEPKKRASFYFVQNVGAILEDDSQNGLAHFLEHMSFNGLEHYPGKAMLNYMEGYGVKFGGDINAYTAQDQTVYNLSNVPVTDNDNLLDSTLLVLHDWSGSLLLEDKEIEAERGVIHEEWRTRRNVRKRLNDQSAPVIYNHSKYVDRDVIGSLDVIDHFKHDELRNYYHKWYRPDLQAVIVVGDIDVNKVEKKIKDMFSSIPLKENAALRNFYTIDNTNETGYVLATDKEAQQESINWIFRLDPDKVHDEAYYRKGIVWSMFSSMLNARYSELIRKPDCPALYMGVGNYSLTRTKDACYIYVSPKENQSKEAFKVLITEFERAKQHGFTQTELERVKSDILSNYESYYKDSAKITNNKWAEDLADNFTSAEPVPTVEWEYKFANKVIPQITLDEVNAIIAEYDNVANSALSLSGPIKEDNYYPTKKELLDIYKNVKSSELSAYEDDSNSNPLITDKLSVHKIVESTPISGVDSTTMYKLDNGAKVILMPTNLSKDKILFSSYSMGGTSLLKRDQLESAELTTSIASLSGAGDFSAIQLQKKLAGKIADVSADLSESTEAFTGSAAPKDFETLLQLLYLKFEHPRFDEESYKMIINHLNSQIVNMATDNNKAFKDTVSLMATNHNDRTLLFNKKFIDNIDFNKAQNIYKDRFEDASDFTFIFVGNIDVKKDLPMIQKYIGSLSSINRKEKAIDHNIRPAKGTSENIFTRKMEVPKSTVYYSITNDIDYNLTTRMYIRAICSLLQKKYLDTIREEEGGSYGVSVYPSITKLPYEHATINISFDCNPDKEEKLRSIVKKEITNLIKNGPDTDDLKEIKENFIVSRENQENNNSFWLSVIQSSLINDEPISDNDAYTAIVNGINAKTITKYAKHLFKKYDTVEVVMNPEE